MTKQHNMQVIVIIDGDTRFSFATVAKARRFAEKMTRAHQVAVELA